MFEREFLIGVKLSLAPATAPGDLHVPGKLRYQACDVNLCYPPATADVDWVVHVVPATAAAKPDRALASVFSGIAFGTGEKPGTETAKASAPSAVATPPSRDDVSLLDDFVVASTDGGYMSTSKFLTFIRNAEAGVKPRGMFEGRGPLAILLLVLIGGLALNLTPCVLPMIPINLAIIGAGAQAQSRRRGFLLGSAYGGAMAFVYGVLGVVVILTAGTFGTINSSPWFNLGIAILFVVLGLAMFDLLLIDFSKYSTRIGRPGSRGSVMLAFTMGGVAALLAGACVAPVVIQVVLFSSNLYATGTRVALALPFFLGHRHGDPVANRGSRHRRAPKARDVDGPRQAGIRRLHPCDRRLLRLRGVRDLRESMGRSVRVDVERSGTAQSRMALVAGRRARGREARKEAGSDRRVGHLVQELPDDGQDDARERRGQEALSGYVKIKFRAEDPDAEPARAILQRLSAPGLPAYAILKPR